MAVFTKSGRPERAARNLCRRQSNPAPRQFVETQTGMVQRLSAAWFTSIKSLCEEGTEWDTYGNVTVMSSPVGDQTRHRRLLDVCLCV